MGQLPPCPYMENGEIHHIKYDMSCNSLFVIYNIKCQFCPLSYIGETDNFRLRVNLHKSNTKNEANRNLKVNKHIHFCSKNKFSITPIFKCKNDDYVYRKEMESVFINSYCPSLNSNSWIYLYSHHQSSIKCSKYRIYIYWHERWMMT